MLFNIPWINSRRRFIFAVFVDLLINFLFYSLGYSRQFEFYPNFIVPICLGLFWVILSYIFGRYMICKTINIKEILQNYVLKLTSFS